jgi:hypothetical protein
VAVKTVSAASTFINGFVIVVTNGVATNHVPVAISQRVITQEDVPKAIELSGTDGDGDVLEYLLVTQTSKGVLSGKPPKLIYIPNPNVSGLDVFGFKVSDGKSGAFSYGEVSVLIESVNDYPVALDQVVDVYKDGSKIISLSGNDVDNDHLNFVVLVLDFVDFELVLLAVVELNLVHLLQLHLLVHQLAQLVVE